MRDYLLENFFGEPVNLRHALGAPNRPTLELQDPKRTICNASVVFWDRWFSILTGSNAAHRVLQQALVRYAPLTQTTTFPEFRATLREVDGLSYMYDSETEYDELDELAIAHHPLGGDEPPPVTRENLRQLLAHASLDHGNFDMRLWDGRLFWQNKATAKTVARARWMAARLGENVEFTPRPLTAIGFCRPKLLALLGDWEIFAVRGLRIGRKVISPGTHALEKVFLDNTPSWAERTAGAPSIESCLDAYGVTHFDVELPHDYQRDWQPADPQERIVFLRKEPGFAARAAEAMRGARFFDLGAHLLGLCDRQEKLASRLSKRCTPNHVSQAHA